MSQAATKISREAAQEEVGRILLAQEDLAYFAEYVSGGWYRSYEMHHLIAQELHLVLDFLKTGIGTQFLLILTPPQHGKSAETSQFFPAFALGKIPNLRVLEISYGDALATKNSRAVRNIVSSPLYQSVFGAMSPSEEQIMLSSDSRSVSAWDLAQPNRGGMVAAGVGGAVTGQPRGLVIIDDPIKDHREALDEKTRNDVWDFYKSAVRVRALAVVMIMTHWHPDDPAGRVLKQMVANPAADQWKVLDLPALIEPGLFATSRAEQRSKMSEGIYMSLRDPMGRKDGEVLCSAMLSRDEMLKIKAGDEFFFSALYQQRPYLREGQRYKRDWFRYVSKLPEGVTVLYIVRYYDKASTLNGDYTVGVLEAYCSDGNYYIIDVIRGRWAPHDRDQEMLKTARRDQAAWGKMRIGHPQDPGSAGLDAAQATNRLLAGYAPFFESVTGSKETRSENLESGMQGSQVFLFRGDWNEAFVEELCAFPNAKYDDQVDAAASAHNWLLNKVGKSRESKIL